MPALGRQVGQQQITSTCRRRQWEGIKNWAARRRKLDTQYMYIHICSDLAWLFFGCLVSWNIILGSCIDRRNQLLHFNKIKLPFNLDCQWRPPMLMAECPLLFLFQQIESTPLNPDASKGSWKTNHHWTSIKKKVRKRIGCENKKRTESLQSTGIYFRHSLSSRKENVSVPPNYLKVIQFPGI